MLNQEPYNNSSRFSNFSFKTHIPACSHKIQKQTLRESYIANIKNHTKFIPNSSVNYPNFNRWTWKQKNKNDWNSCRTPPNVHLLTHRKTLNHDEKIRKKNLRPQHFTQEFTDSNPMYKVECELLVYASNK